MQSSKRHKDALKQVLQEGLFNTNMCRSCCFEDRFVPLLLLRSEKLQEGESH